MDAPIAVYPPLKNSSVHLTTKKKCSALGVSPGNSRTVSAALHTLHLGARCHREPKIQSTHHSRAFFEPIPPNHASTLKIEA